MQLEIFCRFVLSTTVVPRKHLYGFLSQYIGYYVVLQLENNEVRAMNFVWWSGSYVFL